MMPRVIKWSDSFAAASFSSGKCQALEMWPVICEDELPDIMHSFTISDLKGTELRKLLKDSRKPGW